MAPIKITVVTACYNSAETVQKTIESVLKQTVPPFEHIFIDGASGDETLSTIEGYRKMYEERGIILKVISETDRGVYDAMNKGIHASSGEIIGLLNSDDYYEEDALKFLCEAVENDHGLSDIYMGSILIHNGNQIIRKNAKFNHAYQTSRHFNHPAMFATRQAYESVGDYRIGNVHNDYEWFLRALKMGKKVCIIPEVMTHFIIGGVSSRKSFRNTLKRIGLKYEIYSINGYSRFYILECVGQELAKYLLMKKV